MANYSLRPSPSLVSSSYPITTDLDPTIPPTCKSTPLSSIGNILSKPYNPNDSNLRDSLYSEYDTELSATSPPLTSSTNPTPPGCIGYTGRQTGDKRNTTTVIAREVPGRWMTSINGEVEIISFSTNDSLAGGRSSMENNISGMYSNGQNAIGFENGNGSRNGMEKGLGRRVISTASDYSTIGYDREESGMDRHMVDQRSGGGGISGGTQGGGESSVRDEELVGVLRREGYKPDSNSKRITIVDFPSPSIGSPSYLSYSSPSQPFGSSTPAPAPPSALDAPVPSTPENQKRYYYHSNTSTPTEQLLQTPNSPFHDNFKRDRQQQQHEGQGQEQQGSYFDSNHNRSDEGYQQLGSLQQLQHPHDLQRGGSPIYPSPKGMRSVDPLDRFQTNFQSPQAHYPGSNSPSTQLRQYGNQHQYPQHQHLHQHQYTPQSSPGPGSGPGPGPALRPALSLNTTTLTPTILHPPQPLTIELPPPASPISPYLAVKSRRSSVCSTNESILGYEAMKEKNALFRGGEEELIAFSPRRREKQGRAGGGGVVGGSRLKNNALSTVDFWKRFSVVGGMPVQGKESEWLSTANNGRKSIKKWIFIGLFILVCAIAAVVTVVVIKSQQSTKPTIKAAKDV